MSCQSTHSPAGQFLIKISHFFIYFQLSLILCSFTNKQHYYFMHERKTSYLDNDRMPTTGHLPSEMEELIKHDISSTKTVHTHEPVHTQTTIIQIFIWGKISPLNVVCHQSPITVNHLSFLVHISVFKPISRVLWFGWFPLFLWSLLPHVSFADIFRLF